MLEDQHEGHEDHEVTVFLRVFVLFVFVFES